MENADVARILAELGDLLELTGESSFKVRAYRQAAQVIDLLPRPVAELVRAGRLTELPSVGAHIAAKIEEVLERGDCAEHERLAARVPVGLLELLQVEGVGPKTLAAAWQRLGVTDLDALEAACTSGALQELPRMGPARVRAILDAIARHRRRLGRMPLHRALLFAERIVGRLRAMPEVVEAEAAGSVRRRVETVGDLDVLAASIDSAPVVRRFVRMPEVESVLAEGPTKSTVRLRGGLQVDLRVLPPESFGAALHYFTGSKTHNIAVRTLAVRRGLKLSEYGIHDREGHRLGGAREEEVYEAVGLPWIPPELREGTGELEAAAAGRLPRLIEEGDLVGDLHVHSDWSSDGHSRLDELVQEARALGRQYLAITDHSRSRPLGLDVDRLREQGAQLDAINEMLRRAGEYRPRLLRGIEVDILADGTLDLPLDALADLDWVVASVHSRLADPAEAMTERMVRALRSGVVDVLGHPSGRLIGRRDPSSFDLRRVLDVAREEGVAMEVNATPERLDLRDQACRMARDAGVPLVISTDAHHTSQLGNLRFGVWVARRGWVEAGDVLNTRPIEHLRAWRERRRRRHAHHEPAHP